MSERETQKPGPPIVNDQNAMLSGSKSGEAKCPFPHGALKHTVAGTPIERKLVARSAESRNSPSAVVTLESHG